MYPDDYLNREDSATVRFYSTPFEPLNNWSAHQVKIWGKTFATAEHAYQFKKFDMTDNDVADKVLNAPSPWAAYQLAQQYKAQMRDDWHQLKYSIMHEIITAKAAQHIDVQERLNKTAGRTIIEDSPSDSFWGCGADGLGENNLGKIWMDVRDKKDKW
jgi:N-glycosidase YbiA